MSEYRPVRREQNQVSSSAPRFFAPALPDAGEIALGAEEARHAFQVLRLRPGDRVQLFDGKGAMVDGQITAGNRREVRVALCGQLVVDAEPTQAVRVFSALPKGDRQRQMVDWLTQLGTAAFFPLDTSRGVARPTAGALQRLQRAVVEACKQCGRNRLMHVGTPRTVDELCEPADGQTEGHLQMFGHVGADCRPALTVCCSTAWKCLDVAIGPEGGFTADEVSRLRRAGWQAVSLAPHVLRVEVAATIVPACIAAGQALDQFPRTPA
ncbi:MAG: ribosomal RNA small subunit methyltransferase E [Pirellulaceae bacterium]|nr:MAG: ribosomal RNA small subunit methyltransferase E [Pirellulaceae bacterium]